MSRVAVAFHAACYNDLPPFHPGERYPEYPFGGDVGAAANPAYAAVRAALADLELDREHAGTPLWNPLGALVHPGDTVVLKPNFVVSRHAMGGDLFSIITHPSVLRAIADYVAIAQRGEGRIRIVDSPQMDCDFAALRGLIGLDEMCAFYAERGVSMDVVDLRNFQLRDAAVPAFSDNRVVLAGDPAGSVIVDLGGRSHFAGLDNMEQSYGADFNRGPTVASHSGGHHRYAVSATVLDADVVISVPKLKVHKKVGVTLNVKGLVGITTDKNCLVHYRLGSPHQGGDQLPDEVMQRSSAFVRTRRFLFDRLLARQNPVGDVAFRLIHRAYRYLVKPLLPGARIRERQTLDGGNWYGNDTAWRMAADLFTIFSHADRRGSLDGPADRRTFSIVDGIVGGEGDGPLLPSRRAAGCILAGADLLSVDFAAARLMGFDPDRIPLLQRLAAEYGPLDIEVACDRPQVRSMFRNSEPLLGFRAHPGWLGHIEAHPPREALPEPAQAVSSLT